MKTQWDYSLLANAYLKRPDYSMDALNKIFEKCGVGQRHHVCDVGAGVAHLTIPMLEKGFSVVAVEPNDEMRKNGIERTKNYSDVSWVEATGEDTKQEAHIFDFVSFGSSFNVTDRQVTLKEVDRILKSHCWFTCMWNHRDLEDEIQNKIESIITSYITDYNYGVRREDQAGAIVESGLFTDIQEINGHVFHELYVDDCVEAWRSHGTLARQAGDKFSAIIEDIEKYLRSLDQETIKIPYTTRAWIARKKN